ncbi:MAG TPA: antitoxin [Actinomycetota bacterium]|nr:antitoxin [Actinomycetota bacterium]
MSKMIQVRNVPDRLHRELVRRAKARGQTLTDYIQSLLEREVSTPPREEVIARIHSRPKVDLGMSAADLIREARAERERELESR